MRRRVYVAHPIVTYGAARELACMATLRALLPDVQLYDPAGRYSTSSSWLRAWRRVLPTLDGLVVFGTRSNEVGIGCLRELADAHQLGLPVAMLDERRQPRHMVGTLATRRQPTAKRAAVLLAGDLVDLAYLFGATLERTT